jgi:hypothetical protein
MKKRHQNYFQPTEEQRRIVAILSGFNVNQDEICKLIPGALPKPPERQRTPFGAVWEKPPKGTDWMR